MKLLHRGEKRERLRFCFRVAQLQRPELPEMANRAPELLSRIGAEHRVKFAAALLQ